MEPVKHVPNISINLKMKSSAIKILASHLLKFSKILTGMITFTFQAMAHARNAHYTLIQVKIDLNAFLKIVQTIARLISQSQGNVKLALNILIKILKISHNASQTTFLNLEIIERFKILMTITLFTSPILEEFS